MITQRFNRQEAMILVNGFSQVKNILLGVKGTISQLLQLTSKYLGDYQMMSRNLLQMLAKSDRTHHMNATNQIQVCQANCKCPVHFVRILAVGALHDPLLGFVES